MGKAVDLRRTKAKARARTRKLFAKGRLRREDVCLAAAVPLGWVKGPLILDKARPLEDAMEETEDG